MTERESEIDAPVQEALAILSDLEDHAYYTLNDAYAVRRLREVQALLEGVIPPGQEGS